MPISSKRYILIFNATTLIVLHELRELVYIDLIEKIREIGSIKIVIPQSVKNEFLRADIEIHIPSNDIAINQHTNRLPIDIPESLGEGERHAIAIAYTLTQELGMDTVVVVAVVTDDKRARNKCKELGIRVIGTLGLIELAKKQGAISKNQALELLNRIPDTSLYITPELLKEAQNKIKHQ